MSVWVHMYPKIHFRELEKAFPKLKMAARCGEISIQERAAQHPGINPSHGGLLACSANAGIFSQSQQNNPTIIWELKCVWNDKSLKWENLIIRKFLNEQAQCLVWCRRFCAADDTDASSSRHPSRRGWQHFHLWTRFFMSVLNLSRKGIYTHSHLHRNIKVTFIVVIICPQAQCI